MDLRNHDQWLKPPLAEPPQEVLDAAKLVIYKWVIKQKMFVSPDEADSVIEAAIQAALPSIMRWFLNSLPSISTMAPVPNPVTGKTIGYVKGD